MLFLTTWPVSGAGWYMSVFVGWLMGRARLPEVSHLPRMYTGIAALIASKILDPLPISVIECTSNNNAPQ